MKPLNLKTTGQHVAANVRAIREEQRLTIVALSKQLDSLGHRIPPLGLRRIEAGARRVDVDDLFALAVALDVSPRWLLMQDTDKAFSEGELRPVATGLSEDISYDEAQAWYRDESGLSLDSRLEYWTKKLYLIGRELRWITAELASLEAESGNEPKDHDLHSKIELARTGQRSRTALLQIIEERIAFLRESQATLREQPGAAQEIQV